MGIFLTKAHFCAEEIINLNNIFLNIEDAL